MSWTRQVTDDKGRYRCSEVRRATMRRPRLPITIRRTSLRVSAGRPRSSRRRRGNTAALQCPTIVVRCSGSCSIFSAQLLHMALTRPGCQRRAGNPHLLELVAGEDLPEVRAPVTSGIRTPAGSGDGRRALPWWQRRQHHQVADAHDLPAASASATRRRQVPVLPCREQLLALEGLGHVVVSPRLPDPRRRPGCQCRQ